MNITEIIIYLLLGLSFGFLSLFAIYKVVEKSILKEAKQDAQDIVHEAKETVRIEDEERQERIQEIELEFWSKVEEDHLTIEEKCKDLEELIQSKKTGYEEGDKQQRQNLMQNETELRTLSIHLNDVQTAFQKVQNQLEEKKSQYKDELQNKTNLSADEVIQQITQKIESECLSDSEKKLESVDHELKDHAEAKAKRILSLCIDRFSKEMSTERHIATTFFPDEKIRSLFCQNLKDNIAAIQDVTGCDILIDPNPEPERLFNIQVVGYDPVRRELTRRIFDRLFKDTEKSNKPTEPAYIKRIAENIRTELVRQIKRDGDNQAKEMGLQDLHPEIKQVMGSLRYRYSYTQNQYFHCGEVGWFASLLAAELGVNIKKSKRAGLLHDLGKALDHQFDGSHAVIGADFIAARGEADDIVHAVRAHHYDVQPDNDMDFLVIAADAISGGRPGARRSTVEAYSQKVTSLQELAKRFDGVTDVFVLNGGRECRVLVNSRKVDDLGALKISEGIAKTIEEELQYPGQIKVVVVREVIVSESRHVERDNHHGGGHHHNNRGRR